MINVRLYNRKKADGNFSIEAVFDSIQKGLNGRIIFSDASNPTENSTGRLNSSAMSDYTIINHITGDVHYRALWLQSKNTILTIHDIGHYEITLKGLKKAIYKWLWLKWPLSHVKYVTCVSAFTRNRIVEKLGIDPAKIHVIYNPLPTNFNYTSRTFRPRCPVILQIGKGNHKNREGLIQAVKGIPCKLIFIGELKEEHKTLLQAHNIDFENPINVAAEQMPSYYINADIIYFASFYEGFGLPIIESQAVGRPVITSNCASMPEIAGDGAVLVNPGSIVEIQNAIKRLLNDEGFYNKIVLLGIQNVKRFRLSEIAEQYFKLYSTIADASQ